MDPNRYNQQNNRQSPPQNENNYDFIMNPANASARPTLLAPQSATARIAIFAGGIILLIILVSVFFSFLNASGNKQKDNLLGVAKTQQEIIRVIDLSQEFISDRNLDYKVKTLRAVIMTSQQEVTAASAARGSEINPKDLEKSQNPQNDVDLESARAQAKGDEVLNDILLGLLGQYSGQLKAVFDAGNESEKSLSTDAFNQINLIYGVGQNSNSDAQKSTTSQ